MNRYRIVLAVAASLAPVFVLHSQQAGNRPAPAAKTITESDCTAAKLGSEIPAGAIGEPVSAVTLNAPQWHAEANGAPAYCSVEGSMAPVDKRRGRPIRFGVALPASWTSRGVQLGGGGMNGTIPRLTGGVGRGGAPLLGQGFATYGSDSGHQMGGFAMAGGMGMPGGARGGASGQAAPGVPGRGPQGAVPAGAGPGGGMPGRGRGNALWLRRTKSGGRPMGAQRRGHRQSRLHAAQEDARCGHGSDAEGLRRAPAIQLLHRKLTGRPRVAYGGAALPGRLRRYRRRGPDRQLLDPDACAGADSHSGEAARPTG